ncbi:MAG: transporter, partial [Pedosphaera sp.]|nr:transporter [Pedosphaera sp.]
SKRFLLAACLAASVATAALTGCHTEDRSAGRYMDDKQIARRVEGNLKHDPVYKFPDVKVNVFDGVAQLSGFVDTTQQIAQAANLAAKAEGVRQVINDVTLKPRDNLVPTGSPTGRRYESDTTPPNEPNPPRAPIVTPNQNSGTGNPGNTGTGNQ